MTNRYVHQTLSRQQHLMFSFLQRHRKNRWLDEAVSGREQNKEIKQGGKKGRLERSGEGVLSYPCRYATRYSNESIKLFGDHWVQQVAYV